MGTRSCRYCSASKEALLLFLVDILSVITKYGTKSSDVAVKSQQLRSACERRLLTPFDWFYCTLYLIFTSYVICVLYRDLRSFKIWFEFESNDSDLKVTSWFEGTYRRTTNHAHCSTKNFNRCAIVFEIYFMFKIFVYVARAYTLASTVGAIVQYCLRNQKNPHISVRLY